MFGFSVASTGGRAKRDRERARQERAAIKRNRRQADGAPADSADEATDEVAPRPGAGPQASQSDVLAQLAALHQRFEDGEVDFDDFEAAKSELIGQLDVG
jgi:hypothetical protein